MTIDDYIGQYTSQLTKRTTARTVRNYQTYLRRFSEHADATSPNDITSGVIDRFTSQLQKKHTARGGTMSVRTVNYHLIALRSFVQYLQQQGVGHMHPQDITLLKQPSRRRSMLGAHDLTALLDAPLQKKQSEILQRRDAALLELLCSTGLKVSEIAQLTKKDVAPGQSQLAVRGLRGTIRIVPLTYQTRHRLSQYLDLREDAAAALFIPHDAATKGPSQALTPRSIQRIIKKYTRSAELPSDITPETLRQMYARRQSERGEDTQTIQRQLGLASRATARRYLRN